MHDMVEQVIEKLKPALGVNAVELVEVADGVVKVRVFSSACQAGIPEDIILSLLEEQIMEEIPGIREVTAI